jgi:aromatic-L-amino-acid decarboxylase
MVIRTFGHEGLAARIREHIRLAQDLAQRIDADPDFERLAPTPFSTVCFRALPAELRARLAQAGPDEALSIEAYLERLNQAVIEAVNASGQAYFSHTRIGGRYALRMAIGNIRTDQAHVERAWELIRSTARQLDADDRARAGAATP